MKLLTKELEKRFKQVGSQEKIKDPIVIAKFFNPYNQQNKWYATEYNAKQKIFFGYVSLFNDTTCNEWGYFSLEELQQIRLPFNTTLERDLYTGEKPISKMKERDGIV